MFIKILLHTCFSSKNNPPWAESIFCAGFVKHLPYGPWCHSFRYKLLTGRTTCPPLRHTATRPAEVAIKPSSDLDTPQQIKNLIPNSLDVH